jgi:hypothetical protein
MNSKTQLKNTETWQEDSLASFLCTLQTTAQATLWRFLIPCDNIKYETRHPLWHDSTPNYSIVYHTTQPWESATTVTRKFTFTTCRKHMLNFQYKFSWYPTYFTSSKYIPDLKKLRLNKDIYSHICTYWDLSNGVWWYLIAILIRDYGCIYYL